MNELYFPSFLHAARAARSRAESRHTHHFVCSLSSWAGTWAVLDGDELADHVQADANKVVVEHVAVPSVRKVR